MKEKKQKPKELTLMEGNILETPIFTFNKGDNRKKMVFKRETKDELGNPITEKFTMEAPKGIPSAFDQDVYNAIMKLYLSQKGTDKKNIHFTDYKIAKTIQIAFSGERLKRIRESYDRMASTTLKYEGSFYSKGEKITRIFHLLANVERYEKKKGKREINMTKVTLDDIMLKSIDNNYFNLIDFDKYVALPSGVPRRLYEYLEKKKYQKNSFEIGIKKLAKRIPLRTKQISKIKQYLDKANKELKKQGIIDSWKYTKRNTVIYNFTKSERFKEVEKDLLYQEDLIRTFYLATGSDKISQSQLNQGFKVLQTLQKEGYTQDEIEYALKWAVDNIPDVYSIGIIPKLMSQALGDKEGHEIIEKATKKKEIENKKEKEKREKEEQRQKKLDKKFNKLSQKKQNEIESQALKELAEEISGIENFPEPLIRFKRNEILEKNDT